MSTTPKTWKYLVPKPRSAYKQLFVKDRWIAARTLYGMHLTEASPRTPEEIAADYSHLALAHVYVALAYYHANRDEMEADMAAEETESDRIEKEHRRQPVGA